MHHPSRLYVCHAKRIAIAGLISTMIAFPVSAEADEPRRVRQFDNMIYPLPPAEYQNEKRDIERNRPKREWYRATEESHVRLTSPANMSVKLYLLPSEPLKGDIKTWTAERLQRFNEQLNAREISSKKVSVLNSEDREAKVNGRDSAMVVNYLHRGKRKEAAIVRFGVGIVVKGADGIRGEMIIFDCAPEESAKHYTEYFPKFLEEIRFVSEGTPALLGQPTKGSLDGFYLGMRNDYGVNGLELRKEFWVFSPDGRFYRGMPRGRTLSPIDWDDVLKTFPGHCGNYRVAGDKLELEYADGEQSSVRFQPPKRSGGAPTISGIFLTEIEPPPNGTPLEGTYTAQSYTSFTPGSGVVGGVASSRSYAFRKDGTATFDSFVGVSASFENASGDRTGGMTSSDDKPSREGTYRIENGLLILTDAKGNETRKSVLIEGNMLLIDGGHYLGKRKKE